MKVIVNSIVYVIGDILPKLIVFFLIPVLTRKLTVSEYGIYGFLQALLSILNTILMLGITGAVSRFYFDYDDKDDDKRRRLFGSVFVFLSVYVSVGCLVLLTVVGFLPDTFFTNIKRFYYYIIILSAGALSFSAIPISLAFAKKKAMEFSGLQIIRILLNFGLILIFVIIYNMGINGVLYGIGFSSFIMALIYLIYTINSIAICFEIDSIKKVLKYSLPLVPHAISGWILNMSDRVFLERFCSLKELGVYTIGYQLGQSLDFLVSGINRAFLPYFYEIANKVKYAKKVFKESFLIYIYFVILMAFSLILFKDEIFILFTKGDYYQGRFVFSIIIGMSLLHSLYYLSIPSVLLKKKTGILAYSTLSVALVNLFLNFIFIPQYKAIGAAFATLISYSLLFLVTNYFAQKLFKIKWPYAKILISLIVLISLELVLRNMSFELSFQLVIFKLCFMIVLALLGYLMFIKNFKSFVYTKKLINEVKSGKIKLN